MAGPKNECPECHGLRGPWDKVCRSCGFDYSPQDQAQARTKAKEMELCAGCPACAAPRKEGDLECPQCGAVYSKFKAKSEAERLAQEERRAQLLRRGGVTGEGEARGMADVSMSLGTSGGAVMGAVEKERPGCLTLILCLMILMNVLVAALAWAAVRPSQVAVSLLFAVCALAVFRWKKWGVVGIYFFYVADMLGIWYFGMHPFFIFMDIAGLCIFMYFVRSVFHHFD